MGYGYLEQISLSFETGTVGYGISRPKLNRIWDALTPHNGASLLRGLKFRRGVCITSLTQASEIGNEQVYADINVKAMRVTFRSFPNGFLGLSFPWI